MAYNRNHYNNAYNNRMSFQQPTPVKEVMEERCDDRMEPVDKMPIAMCYVPWQKWESIFDVEKGLDCGTIFPCLYKPFKGVRH